MTTASRHTPTRPDGRDLRAVRANYHSLAQTLRGLEVDLRWGLQDTDRIPAAWHTIAQEPGVPFKASMTLRVDEDVVRFFKAMGRGHLTRMNAVLRAFMQARLAGVVKGPEDVEYQPTDHESYLVESVALIERINLRNAHSRNGQGTVDQDVEIDRSMARLKAMADELGLAPQDRILG